VETDNWTFVHNNVALASRFLNVQFVSYSRY
jgi:hypothetical protein